MHDVLEWVPFRGPAADAVLDVLGLEREDPPRVLAVLKREVVLKAIEETKVGEQVKVSLTLAQCAKVELLYDTCRLRCGLAATQEQKAKQREEASRLELAKVVQQTSAPPANTTNMISLKDTVSQVSEKVVEPLADDDITKAYAAYNDVHKDEPPEDEEPTEEQLAGIRGLTDARKPPAPDFAVFKPNAMRDDKIIAFRGMIQLGPGKWRMMQLKGPACFADWLPSWKLLKTSLIMLVLVTLGTLNAYERMITTWAHRYGRRAWA